MSEQRALSDVSGQASKRYAPVDLDVETPCRGCPVSTLLPTAALTFSDGCLSALGLASASDVSACGVRSE
jgi:hypothetical protein